MSPDLDTGRAMNEANVRLVRKCVLVLIAAAVAVLIVSALIGGWGGLAGAAIGAAIVIAFFGLDLLALRGSRSLEPTSVLVVVVMVYTFKITLLAVFLVALRGTSAFDTSGFALAVIVLTSVALGCALVLVAKRQTLLVDPDAASPGPNDVETNPDS